MHSRHRHIHPARPARAQHIVAKRHSPHLLHQRLSSSASPTLAAHAVPRLPAIPAAAAIAGFLYYNNNPFPSDALLIGLGLVAAAPALFNVMNQAPPVAVLLPMIDSINHLEEAVSHIEYSPLSDAFTLSLGENCVVDESGKTQLYISYGRKKDTELLLNYGFLLGVPSSGDARTRRKALATAFLARQQS